MTHEQRKRSGAYYTPDATVRALVTWAVRRGSDRMLDPSCGDGRFLAAHRRSVGVEQDRDASAKARQRAPSASIYEGDFFRWASETTERFDCAAGNPPFIRYQRFAGGTRRSALEVCEKLSARFSALTGSWAPFLVATASLLKPGARMAFVVPAEIGHAPYAKPLLAYLAARFAKVQLVAVRKKIFAELSEDVWLLYAEGFGSRTQHFSLSTCESFGYTEAPPRVTTRVPLADWEKWNARLRPFLMPAAVRESYRTAADGPDCIQLGAIARVGIGYVTGDNDFFHLRPSDAKALCIPPRFLQPTVRNGRALTGRAVTDHVIETWQRRDDPMLLLRLRRDDRLPTAVRRYLDSAAGRKARTTYKCRNRHPWYAVPDVTIPDGFLSYMSGNRPALVANQARCACTNSVHVVAVRNGLSFGALQRRWDDPIVKLSCEIEGHPLGGGMLKLEPREAARVILPSVPTREEMLPLVQDGIATMKLWRHYGGT